MNIDSDDDFEDFLNFKHNYNPPLPPPSRVYKNIFFEKRALKQEEYKDFISSKEHDRDRDGYGEEDNFLAFMTFISGRGRGYCDDDDVECLSFMSAKQN